MALAGRGSDQFLVRMPPGMRDRVQRLANKHMRSANSQFVVLIGAALAVEDAEEDRAGKLASPASPITPALQGGAITING